MHLVKSLAVALSMYSKIPVPAVEWKEENMKYAMCFFPVVGAAVGVLQYLAATVLLGFTDCGVVLFSAVMTLIPVLVTGGIHLDGFADTTDAPCLMGKQREKAGDSERSPHRRLCRDRSVLLASLYICSVERSAGQREQPEHSGGGLLYVCALQSAERDLSGDLSGGKKQRPSQNISGQRPQDQSSDRAHSMGGSGRDSDVPSVAGPRGCNAGGRGCDLSFTITVCVKSSSEVRQEIWPGIFSSSVNWECWQPLFWQEVFYGSDFYPASAHAGK